MKKELNQKYQNNAKGKISENKGITLIALVITIIVLIILAGVSISLVLGENGLLNKAQDAKEKIEKAEDDELRQIAIAEATMNFENTEYTDKNGEKVTIPAGFSVSGVEGENTVENGLVIIDSKGNEFVWIPINKENLTVLGTDKTIAHLKQNSPTDYESILYDFTLNGDLTISTEKQDYGCETDSYREPSTIDTDSTNSVNINEFQKDYNNMINSIKNNGGFYVGRYEMSLTNATDVDSNVDGTAQSKKGVKSSLMSDTSTKEWYGLYRKAKTYSTSTINSDSVESSMIYGCQWDAMLNWLLSKDVNVASINEPILNSAKNTEQITGKSEKDKIKNIYDLMGCNYEITQEAFGNDIRIRRGGNYISNSMSNRTNTIQATSHSTLVSTRLTLYIK